MASILGIGNIAGGIVSGIGSILEFLKSIAQVVVQVLSSIVKWYLELLADKPELGITLGILTIYLLV